MIKAIKSIQTFTKPEKELKNPDNLNFNENRDYNIHSKCTFQ